MRGHSNCSQCLEALTDCICVKLIVVFTVPIPPVGINLGLVEFENVHKGNTCS